MTPKPWLHSYDLGVPYTLEPYPDATLVDLFDRNALERPNHPALLFQGRSFTYAQVNRSSDAFAAALVALGLQPGERLALLLPNSPQFVVCQLGGWKAGAIVAPINPRYTETEMVHALNETEAETAIVLTPFYDNLKAWQSQTGLQRVIACNIKNCLPWPTRWLFTLFREAQEGHRIKLRPGDLWLDVLLRQHAHAPRPNRQPRPGDPALLLFTGGTTGRAKAALGTHQGLLISGLQINAWIGQMSQPWQDVNLLFMPLFHAYGNAGAFSTAVAGRQTMALVPNPRDLDDLIKIIGQTRPAYVACVPTLLIALLEHPAVQAGKVDFRSIKVVLSGAAPLLAETRRRFETLTGGHIVEGYALTESMLAAVISPVLGPNKPGAIGLPLPDVNICIIDPDNGQEILPAGKVGEILLHAPQLMQGYWQRPAETAQAFRDGWLVTGDLGYLDEDGYLFLVDRSKDVIKPSGFQVWPREVEEVIATHPAVAEVGVAGIPDPRQGEAVKAWIVIKKDQQLGAEELRNYCRQQLAAYKIPRQIEFRDSLPKSMVGKVLRRELVAEEMGADGQQ